MCIRDRLEEEASSARPPLFVLAERTERLLAGLGFDWPEPEPAAIRRLVRLAIGRADPDDDPRPRP